MSKQPGKNSQYALCASQWHKTLTYKDDFFKDGMTYDADFTNEFGYAILANKMITWVKANAKVINTISACVLIVIAGIIAFMQQY